LTKAAFARRIGVSAARISQLINRGMPVRSDGRIEVAEALAWLDDNLDTSKRAGGIRPPPCAETGGDGDGRGGASVGGRSTGGAAVGPGRIGVGSAIGGPGGPSLAEAKRLHELVKVQRAKLALRA